MQLAAAGNGTHSRVERTASFLDQALASLSQVLFPLIELDAYSAALSNTFALSPKRLLFRYVCTLSENRSHVGSTCRMCCSTQRHQSQRQSLCDHYDRLDAVLCMQEENQCATLTFAVFAGRCYLLNSIY